MDEPSRIGLSAETAILLEELLEDLNPKQGEEGVRLIKFDLYRLAVAIGIKRGDQPPELSDRSSTSFRVNELDPDGVLYTALDSSGLTPEGTPIYSYIERLAEAGIKTLSKAQQQTGDLPWAQYFTE
jgi:hypothetical protein